MSPDPHTLAARVSAETGIEFVGVEGRDGDGSRWFELRPAGHPTGRTFTLRSIIGWRRIEVQFKPGSFASDLMAAMGSTGETGRKAFAAVLDACTVDGAEVVVIVNGTVVDPHDPKTWTTPWRSLALTIRRGMLSINEGDAEADMRLIGLWTSRVAAAIVALLPLESDVEDGDDMPREVNGLPEGAKTLVEVNRYERDRRNRAAALAIHGYLCQACGVSMEERYGPAANGLIEVHHTTPVSEVGPGYVVDPTVDLVPLCPNCHSVAHRRSPPYTVDELRAMQGRQ